MKLFVFGNGNIPFEIFIERYAQVIDKVLEIDSKTEFVICEFRGTDTLTLEYLKTRTSNVTVLHIGDKPRYKPDIFKTYVSDWNFSGSFASDIERDMAAIRMCTHFLAYDFNSDKNRISGTRKNIDKCISLNKIAIPDIE